MQQHQSGPVVIETGNPGSKLESIRGHTDEAINCS